MPTRKPPGNALPCMTIMRNDAINLVKPIDNNTVDVFVMRKELSADLTKIWSQV